MSVYLTWLADVLEAAGLTVITYPGWTTRGAAGRTYPNGGFLTASPAVVWHHDASAPGDSPTVPASMLRRWDTAAAQLWVSRTGTWHVLAAGVAWHTGAVLPGAPSNWRALGVETDHTIAEPWPEDQLSSLRRGTAAILAHLGLTSQALHFHRTICQPPGRKIDPDGLDLAHERSTLAAMLTPLPDPPKGSTMAALVRVRGTRHVFYSDMWRRRWVTEHALNVYRAQMARCGIPNDVQEIWPEDLDIFGPLEGPAPE